MLHVLKKYLDPKIYGSEADDIKRLKEQKVVGVHASNLLKNEDLEKVLEHLLLTTVLERIDTHKHKDSISKQKEIDAVFIFMELLTNIDTQGMLAKEQLTKDLS